MYENGEQVNRHKAKMKHKRKMKNRARAYRSHSWEDYVAHRRSAVLNELDCADDFMYDYLLRRLERDLRDIEAYWKHQNFERWWNKSGGKGSYKDWWQKNCNRKERNYWREQLKKIPKEEDLDELDVPKFRRGHHFGSTNDLW